MSLDRRAFLSMLAGSPLIFGLRELSAQDPPAKETPDWYRAALKRMKETNRYGIVFILPDDPKEREEWGKALIDRYNEHFSYRHEPFGVVVFIALTRDLAARLLEGDIRGRNVFVLEPSGRTLLRAWEEIDTVQSRRGFETIFSEHAYGLRDRRLGDQAQRLDTSVTDAVRKAVQDLAGDEPRPTAQRILLESADSILPWIVNRCRESESGLKGIDGERPDAGQLRLTLVEYWRRQSILETDPCLPFGMKVEMAKEPDLCPPCGRTMIGPGRARKFISLLEK